MEYHHLGGSGLRVSRVGLGCIPFGTALGERDSRRTVDAFADAGGNYLDTANVYGGGTRGSHEQHAGTSERTIGKLIKGRRDRFVVGTKGAWVMTDAPHANSFGLSRAYLGNEIDASLRRLGTDYIDLYHCHVQDPYTPIEETMRVLDDSVRAGKIRYVGVSNWGGWQVVKACMYARQHGLSPILCNQIWYNLADRTAEFAIVPACRDQGVSVTVWGGYAQGFLTGRYDRAMGEPPAGSRITSSKPSESSSWQRLAVARVWNTLDVMRGIATRHGWSLANVAMAWLLQSGHCDVFLMGAFAYDQVPDGLAGAERKLSAEDIGELDDASELEAPYPMSFWNTFVYEDSEYYGGLR